jgi:hypothetical protein
MIELTRRLFLARTSAAVAAAGLPAVAVLAKPEFNPAALDAALQRHGVVAYRHGRSGLCFHAHDEEHAAAHRAGLFAVYEANRPAFRSYLLAQPQRPPSPLKIRV